MVSCKKVAQNGAMLTSTHQMIHGFDILRRSWRAGTPNALWSLQEIYLLLAIDFKVSVGA